MEWTARWIRVMGSGVCRDSDDSVCASGELCVTDTCDPTAGCASSVTPNCCGNGLTEGTEECDDGNDVDGDGCDSTCMEEFQCPEDCIGANTLSKDAVQKLTAFDGAEDDQFGKVIEIY